MKLDIVWDCEEGITLAGLTAKEWMRRTLAPLLQQTKGARYVLAVKDAMPLLDEAFLLKTAEYLRKKGAVRAVFEGGYLQKEGAQGKCVRVACLECALPKADVLSKMTETLYRKQAERLLAEGAVLLAPQTVCADGNVRVGKGSVIHPFCVLKGETSVGEGCEVGSYSTLENATVGNRSTILSSVLSNCTVGEDCTVGPFSYLRAGATLKNRVRVGDFVEIKASLLSSGVKAAHHAYIGDAEVGEGTNLGCGAVFANYNGKQKQKTVVGKNVFVGSNVNLVAPLQVGDNAYIAAGSTVTVDVPSDAFVIARERETIKNKKQ